MNDAEKLLRDWVDAWNEVCEASDKHMRLHDAGLAGEVSAHTVQLAEADLAEAEIRYRASRELARRWVEKNDVG